MHTIHPAAFKTFCTLKLGIGPRTANDFRRALKHARCHIGPWADDILSQPGFTVVESEMEVELFVVSVAELGFPGGANLVKIYKRLPEVGLGLCLPEVGPQLRLQYKEQPEGESLLVGMEPVTGEDSRLKVFEIKREKDDLFLHGNYGYPGDFWLGHFRWVFMRHTPTSW